MLMLTRTFSILIIFIICHEECYSIPLNNSTKTIIASNNQSALTTSYNELLNDVRWFFQRMEDFTITAEQLLPNVSTSGREMRTFSDYTRFNFLIGLRHLLIGVKEISITFRKSLEEENMRQLQYVIDATNIIHNALKTLKIWFSNFRTLVGEIFRFYNRHLPEVLLGKCLGRYVVATYPERAFYEYPYLLLTDIFHTILGSSITTESVDTSTEPEHAQNIGGDVTTESITIDQNEIPNHIDEDFKIDIRGRAFSENETDYTSFFNFSDVLGEDKESVIENAIEKHTWQKCFKLYTAETIVRKLQVYFLAIE